MRRRKQGETATAAASGGKWSAEDARRILDEWSASGLTLYHFAKQRQLVPQRLWWWHKRLRGPGGAVADTAGPPRAPSFVPMAIKPVEMEPCRAAVELGDGLRIELHALDASSAAWVAQLWKALRGAP